MRIHYYIQLYNIMKMRYKILSPSGFQCFDDIVKKKKDTIKIIFDDSTYITVTKNHLFIENNKEVMSCDLSPGCKLNNKNIISIIDNGIIDVYDPVNVAGGNLYYSNGLISHNCSFLGSSLTLISADVIASLSYTTPIYSKDGLDVYENPVRGEKDSAGKIVTQPHTYVIAVDTAKGVGGDASTFSVIDITQVPYKVVAKYRNNNISPMLYPSVINKIATDYNKAYVIVEINSSEQVAYILYSELEYENLVFITRTTKGQSASAGFAGAGKTALGINMDKRVKRVGCFTLKALLEEKKLLITDADTIAEISTFIESKGTYAADDGYHDDLVMTLVIFSWLTTNPYFKELTNVNLRTEMYQQRIIQIEEEMTPFGFIQDGSEEEFYVEDGDTWKVMGHQGYLPSNF